MNADNALAAYRKAFGAEPKMLVRAPGRVNLIGEHTDYNDGFVLPCAIDFETMVAIGDTDDGALYAVSANYGDAVDRFDLTGGYAASDHPWANYVRAVAQVLVEDGLALSGARLAIAGDVPLGSGLSSSASLEVAVGYALAQLAGQDIDPDRLALLMQKAENIYVGCQCGIMDQLISTRGIAGNALLIDCRSLHCRPVPMPVGAALIIAHSGVRHAHADGEYNLRRLQCGAAVAHYSVAALRDLDFAALESGKAGLDDTAYRRARHVVTENERTVRAAAALADGDLAQMGTLMRESHASMRDDYQITVPAIDQLADIMNRAIGTDGGARMTGGGFGGCVIGLVSEARVGDVVGAIRNEYPIANAAENGIYVCKASAGVGMVTKW